MSIVFRFSLKNSADQVTLSNTKVSELGLFKSNPNLLQRGRYTVTSNIRLETLEYFVTRLDGDAKPGGVTPDNAKELQLLCDELGFTGLNAEIRAVVGDEKSAMRRDLILMRDRMDRQEVVLERLQRQVLEIERQLKAQGPPGGEEKDTSELATEVSDLSTTVTTLATEVSDLAALTASIAEVLPEVEGKAGVAGAGLVVLDGHVQGAALAHQHHQLFAARDAGIDQVALQQHVMLHHQRDDHGRVFRAL